MVEDALRRLEAYCAEGAPELLRDLETVRLLAVGGRLSESLTRPPVSLAGEGAEDPTVEVAVLPSCGAPDRYVDLGLIGRGGMGEVRRVRDRELNRVVAMKRLHVDGDLGPAAVARFVEEVQTTAQLQHPNIVPVYDAGRTADGQVYFTMKEVQGRTLREVLREVHVASVDRWASSPGGWNFRRLVTTLHQVSQAVAYAHQRGVLHRDLKPANVMVGAFGEVLVMDWGLAKVLGRAELPDERVVVASDREATRVGHAVGTPAYMSPEQARGEHDLVDTRADVYALGAMLYELLAGRPPYRGVSGADVLFQVVTGPPRPPRRPVHWIPDDIADAITPFLLEPDPSEAASPELELPPELVAACVRAMAREPEQRFATAAAFASELEAWLDGSRRREQALELVEQGERTVPMAEELRRRAEALRAQAAAELAAVPSWAPEDEKLAAWAKEDEAAALATRADLAAVEREQLLAGALTHAPDLPEARAALAEDHLARHADAEARHDASTAAHAEALLRVHVSALPAGHPVRTRGIAYLRGTGALTLVTEPEGASVELHRFEPYGRRLVARRVGDLGRTPLVEVPLPMGSWLLVIRHPERAPVRYPVHIGRLAHWDGVRPGSSEPFPIPLPRADELGPDDVYVPAGRFLAGGFIEAGARPFGPLWLDGFVVRRHPVTNREFIPFLDELVAAGREDEALSHAPRERSATRDDAGPPYYGRDADGRFVLQPDADGDVWLPDWPVIAVNWNAATAYAAWLARREGAPWRLLADYEREKAARGVDGRLKPWGDEFDPSYANMRESRPGHAMLATVGAYAVDESVYGARGIGGNTSDWCLDLYTPRGPAFEDGIARPLLPPDDVAERAERVYRGGRWYSVAGHFRSSIRQSAPPLYRDAALGIRVARSWPGPVERDQGVTGQQRGDGTAGSPQQTSPGRPQA